jgi:hypothetical protein
MVLQAILPEAGPGEESDLELPLIQDRLPESVGKKITRMTALVSVDPHLDSIEPAPPRSTGTGAVGEWRAIGNAFGDHRAPV